MATNAAYSGNDPHQLLSSIREHARRVRMTQRATWFPLLVLAAATFAAIPAYRLTGHLVGSCATLPAGGRICAVESTAAYVYWPIALVLAYVAIAAFYVRRSRARGVETRVRPYVIAGIILAAAVTAAALWVFHHPLARYDLPGLPGQPGLAGLSGRLATSACAIGLALLVLARAERNGPLAVLAVGYLAAVLVPVTFGWVISLPDWFFVPRLVIDGSVLLLGGTGFLLAQRPWQHAA
jgi:hypothetical protein